MRLGGLGGKGNVNGVFWGLASFGKVEDVYTQKTSKTKNYFFTRLFQLPISGANRALPVVSGSSTVAMTSRIPYISFHKF